MSMPRPSSVSARHAFFWLAELLAFCALAGVGAFAARALAEPDPASWIGWLADDAYYYLGVARNVASHGDSAYSLPFETNGYQPLWMALLCAGARLLGSEPARLAGLAIGLCVALSLAFAVAAKKIHGSAWPAALAILAFGAATLKGMETALLPLLCILYLRPGLGWKAKGVLGSLILLARLDALCLLVAWDAVLAFRGARPGARHWAIVAAAAAGYALWSQAYFGVPVPASGLAKAASHVPALNLVVAEQWARWAAPTLVLLLATWTAAWTRRRALRHCDQIMALLGAIALHAAYYSLASGWCLWEWYFWPLAPLLYYVLSGVGPLLAAWGHRAFARFALGFSLAVLAFLAAGAPALGTLAQASHISASASLKAGLAQGYAFRNAQDALFLASLPPGLTVGMGDRAGSLGFLSPQTHLFQAEGLVAPLAYGRALRAGEGLAYVEAMRPDFWIADRGRLMRQADVIGAPEPIQAFEASSQPYLLCFKASGMSRVRSGPGFERAMFDWRSKTECPAQMLAQFHRLRGSFGALRESGLPMEFPHASKAALGLSQLLSP